MAFFKFRKSGEEQSAAQKPPESVEEMRARAKYRLIGAAVLVLVGVVGFPLLFDKQPRPIAVDMPIDIPDRNKAVPLSIPAPVASSVGSGARGSAVAESVRVVPDSPAVVEKPVPAVAMAVQKAPEAPPTWDSKPATKVSKVLPPAPPVPSGANDGAKAQALLEGVVPANEAPAMGGRFVVQVGAFADAARAREVRLKMEHAGLKTYTHVAETKDGRRIRVRVGPFSTKAEADVAAEKIKKLDLAAAILTL